MSASANAGTFSALILAGGRSSRMGSDKAQLRLGQVSLLERSVIALPSQVAEILILGAQPQPFASDELSERIVWVEEETPFQGPVAAIAGALPAVTGEWVLMLPCDLAAPTRAVEYLLASAETLIASPSEKSDAVIARDDEGNTQWLTGLFRTAALRENFERLESTDVSVRVALTGLSISFVTPPEGEPGIWEDMDTPEDFHRVLEELS